MPEGVGTIIGAVIGAATALIGQIIQLRAVPKRKKMLELANQYASFYELEKLYLEEIENLRNGKEPSGTSKKANSIKKEFRARNEENENPHIDLTALSAGKLASEL